MPASNVFITGASSGIGAALARRYARRGAILGLVARRKDKLDALHAELGGLGRAYTADVTDADELRDAARLHLRDFGVPDVVIANAGVSAGTLTELEEDLEVFERIVRTNLVAIVATFQPFVDAMKLRGSGTLVVVASVAGLRGLPGAGAYSASKAGAIAYAEGLRVELRRYGVRVVTIAPGYIDTPMTRRNRYWMPFLMSADAFAARAVVAIDAGRRFHVIPWPMAIIATLLRRMPDALYDRLFARAPRKGRTSARADGSPVTKVSGDDDPATLTPDMFAPAPSPLGHAATLPKRRSRVTTWQDRATWPDQKR